MNFSKKFFLDKLAASISRTSKTLTLVCLAAFALILFRTAWVGDDVYITLPTDSEILLDGELYYKNGRLMFKIKP
jgi:hypothetical protein